jgi:hypothetical protein
MRVTATALKSGKPIFYGKKYPGSGSGINYFILLLSLAPETIRSNPSRKKVLFYFHPTFIPPG